VARAGQVLKTVAADLSAADPNEASRDAGTGDDLTLHGQTGNVDPEGQDLIGPARVGIGVGGIVGPREGDRVVIRRAPAANVAGRKRAMTAGLAPVARGVVDREDPLGSFLPSSVTVCNSLRTRRSNSMSSMRMSATDSTRFLLPSRSRNWNKCAAADREVLPQAVRGVKVPGEMVPGEMVLDVTAGRVVKLVLRETAARGANLAGQTEQAAHPGIPANVPDGRPKRRNNDFGRTQEFKPQMDTN
jgi:hypothetical protein